MPGFDNFVIFEFPYDFDATRCTSKATRRSDCPSFTVADGLIGIQDGKLPPAERKARTLIFDRHEMAAFIAGAKNGDFDQLLD